MISGRDESSLIRLILEANFADYPLHCTLDLFLKINKLANACLLYK